MKTNKIAEFEIAEFDAWLRECGYDESVTLQHLHPSRADALEFRCPKCNITRVVVKVYKDKPRK